MKNKGREYHEDAETLKESNAEVVLDMLISSKDLSEGLKRENFKSMVRLTVENRIDRLLEKQIVLNLVDDLTRNLYDSGLFKS